MDIEENTQKWFDSFPKADIEDLDKPILYTLDKLYENDVKNEEFPELTEEVLSVYRKLWKKKERWWAGELPEGWERCDYRFFSPRSCICETSKYPELIFKFCSGSPGRGVPGSHFLRVPKGKELKRIIQEEKLDKLEIVNEYLIAIKTIEEIKKMLEGEQCYNFVVVSELENLMDEDESLRYLKNLTGNSQRIIAEQLIRLICKSGISDLKTNNIRVHRNTKKVIIIDTEPIYGSMLLQEKATSCEYQYSRYNQLKKLYPKGKVIMESLDSMMEIYEDYDLSIFVKIAQIYKRQFLKKYQKD